MDITGLDEEGLAAIAYSAFGERFPVALVVFDPELRILWTSPAAHDLLEHPAGSLLGMNVVDLVHPDDLDQIGPMVAEIVDRASETLVSPAAASLIEVPARVRTGAGGWLPVAVSGRVLDDAGHLLGVVRPASERHAFDAVLDALAGGDPIDSVLGAVVDLVRAQFGLDAAWLVHDAEGQAVVLGPCPDAEVGEPGELLAVMRGTGPSSETYADDRRWVVPLLSATEESLFGALVLPSPRDGGPNPFDAHVLHRTAALASLAFTRDRDDRLLRRAATTDHLTGVANRRAFESTLAQCALRPETFPITLFLVDVDEFKAVNDSHGHPTGDEVLVAVAARLGATAREGDMVGRLGGDEFAVACTGLPAQEIEPMRCRLADAVAEPVVVPLVEEVVTVAVTVSVGVATAQDEDDLETLIDRSDSDMFARKSGRRSTEGALRLES